VLRVIFAPKRDEVKGCLIKLHNDEPQNVYSWPDVISTMELRRVR
jgi:hypothetical protein